MDKFDDKYRIESHRLYGWDYSKDGIYFITLVIENRRSVLGKIQNDNILLSDFGKIVREEWIKSFKIRDELFLYDFVIMPNHLYGLITINTNFSTDVETHGRASLQSYAPAKYPRQNIPIQQDFVRKPKSLSSFIAGFKSATTSKIDEYIDQYCLDTPKYDRQNKLWQPNYHDRIVRNREEFWKIKTYITHNPANWKEDEYNI